MPPGRNEKLRGIVDKKYLSHAKIILKRDNRKFPPDLVEIKKEDWSDAQKQNDRMIGVFRSRFYLVQIFKEDKTLCRITVNRTCLNDKGDWLDGISWDDLQKIKDEVGYGDKDAVEVYPANQKKVDVANMRHLFVFENELEYAWKGNQ